MTRYRAQVSLLLGLCALMGLSCNLLQTLSQDSDSNLASTPEQTQFVIPTLEPSPKPSEPCPVPTSSPAPVISAEVYDILNSITEYLNAGGGLNELEDRIEELALLIQETPTIIKGDFNGDGFLDLVISILLPSEEVYPLSGQSHIYMCQDSGYKLTYSTPGDNQLGLPRFYAIDDLTGDEITDLILGIENCGAHTCTTAIQALVWTGSSFENRLQGSSDDLPSPIIEVNKEHNEIIVTGEGVGSVGAGPNRGVERHWYWDSNLQSFIPSQDILLPSTFRIHVLHDADRALVEGDFDSAIEGYYQVQQNEQLLEWVDPETERANLAAYAGFKLVLVHLLSGDTEKSKSILEELILQYPDGTTGSSFRAMAERFWDEYQATNDIAAACTIAQAFANENSPQILEALYFGYANPVYSAGDICPLLNGATQ